MTDHYAVLGVHPEASTRDIKSAFRKKAKDHHPDLVSGDGKKRPRGDAMLVILEAYRILSDPERRHEYDAERRRRRHKAAEDSGFDYRRWLLERQDESEYRAKLVFYDLLHDLDDEALSVYDALTKRADGRLERYFERAEAAEAEFCIAELFEARGRARDAFELYLKLARIEAERPVFGYFFEVVLEYWKRLVLGSLAGELAPPEYAEALARAAAAAPDRKLGAAFERRRAETLAELGDAEGAAEAFDAAERLFPSMPGLDLLRKRLGNRSRS